MANSTHKVEVIRINSIEPHPNADRLDIVHVYGYTTCVAKGDFAVGDLAAFIPPDSVVPNTPQFAFLDGHLRIKAKKLRGTVSYGFLSKAPEGSQEGDDVAELMQITHYEPPEPTIFGADSIPAPEGYHPNYDVDALLRYPDVFEPNERLWVTEKIHGANARYTYIEGVLYAGSRTMWKSPTNNSIWWRVANENPIIEEFLQAHPGITLYGEIYGSVQSLHYGCKPGELRFAVFDILYKSQWLAPQEGRDLASELPWVPLIDPTMAYNIERARSIADGPSLVKGADHLREGVVIRPLHERVHPEIGRVCLKVVSATFLEKDK